MFKIGDIIVSDMEPNRILVIHGYKKDYYRVTTYNNMNYNFGYLSHIAADGYSLYIKTILESL